MQICKRTGNLLLSICLLFPSAFVFADSNAGSQPSIEQINSKWNMHFNNANPVALSEMYAEDAIVSPGNGTTLHGRTAIHDLFAGFFENGLHEHSIDTISSFREGNVITQVARWQAYGPSSEGQKPVYGGILVSVLKQDNNGDWKTYLHLWNMSS